MPQNVTDVSAFTDPVVEMADSDPLDATYARTAVQGLANRTRFLLDRENVTRDLDLGRHLIVDNSGLGWACNEVGTPFQRLFSTQNAGQLWVAVPLERGDKLTKVHLSIQPGAARSGANKMVFSVLELAMNRSTGAVTRNPISGATVSDDGTANQQLIVLTLAAAPYVKVDGAVAWVLIKAGNTGAASPDRLDGGWIEVSLV